MPRTRQQERQTQREKEEGKVSRAGMEMDPLYGQVEEHTSADERDSAQSQWDMGMERFKEDGEAGQWLPPLSQAGLGQGGDEAGSEQGPPSS